jgi:hypothetical protein
MITGGLGLVLSMFYWNSWGGGWHRRSAAVYRDTNGYTQRQRIDETLS